MENFLRKKLRRKIPDNTYRVIKISKDALYEFISESFIDNQEQFLDISDGTKIISSYGVDWENDSFIFVAQNLVSEEMPWGKEIDISKISEAIPDTTSTMYKQGRYIDLSQKQIDDIQKS